MADKTSIEWTRGPDGSPGATWNPITGCTLVSEGCRHCYAAQLAATRLKNHPTRAGLARLNAAGEAKFTGEVRLNEQWLDQPIRWMRPRRIFVCAHGDLFHEDVPDEWIDRVFRIMAMAKRHTFQVLTKRPGRALRYLDAPDRELAIRSNALAWPLPNVWLGTSVEDQATADERIPHLLAAPARVRFLSAEPLLGPVALTSEYLTAKLGAYPFPGLPREDRTTIADMLDWVIVGGESGKHARPMHPDWARSLRDQCVAAGVPFFFKQWGEWLPFGQSGFTAWLAHTSANGSVRKAKGKWWGHAYFNDGAGGPNTHAFGPVETMIIDNKSTQAVRIGKARAGRVLDGRTWDETPAYHSPSQLPAQT